MMTAVPSGGTSGEAHRDPSPLFAPVQIGTLSLKNRIAMAPMTRMRSPGGVPGSDVADYYKRRAAGGVGLIITEGTYVDHWAAGFSPNVPLFYGEAAMAGWRTVVEEVHHAGALIMPQLWHVGLVETPEVKHLTNAPDKVRGVGPSGLLGARQQICTPMAEADIAAVAASFGKAAGTAKAIGFDGIELHGAHGYLIDQFLWEVTNQRSDDWGGDIGRRSRFAAAIVEACRAEVGPDFPIVLRISQWKQQDYDARLTLTPEQLEAVLGPLVDAGVDIFHCSQRRFWQPEFPGSKLSFAGWTKKISGKPVITVGSVGLEQDFIQSLFQDEGSDTQRIDRLLEMLHDGEFDLVAVGRALVSDPEWPDKVSRGAYETLLPYMSESLATLD